MNKSYRHSKILKIIRAKEIYTQEELAAELNAVGIPATQVTLSRDIRELGLSKTPQGYRQIEAGRPARTDVKAVVAEFLLDVRVAQNLVVLRTAPGNANALAAALDSAEWPEIVGTIAGDDTILIIAPDSPVASALAAKLRGMVG